MIDTGVNKSSIGSQPVGGSETGSISWKHYRQDTYATFCPHTSAPEPRRPPMVCVKLPNSVLVVFHVLESNEVAKNFSV